MRRKTNGTVDRHFLWDNGQLVLEVDGTNSAPYFYSHDQRGNTTGLTSGSSVLESRHFSPWGVEEFGVSIPENSKFGWKGLPWEAGVANLYYVRHRWYDPQSRGFISEDPIELAGGMNTYAYGDNDPVDRWDPTGLSTECRKVHVRGYTVTAGSQRWTTPGYDYWVCENTTGGDNGNGQGSGSGNPGGGGGQGSSDDAAKAKSCSAARAYIRQVGQQFSRVGTTLNYAGMGIVFGSGALAILQPETVLFDGEGAETGVTLMEFAGKLSAAGAALQGYANGGLEGGLEGLVTSVGLDYVGSGIGKSAWAAYSEATQAVGASALTDVLDRLNEAVHTEEGCGGE